MHPNTSMQMSGHTKKRKNVAGDAVGDVFVALQPSDDVSVTIIETTNNRPVGMIAI